MRYQPTNSYLLTKLILGVFTVSVLASCDLLEQEPRGQLTTAAFFETPQQAIYATNATYNILRSYNMIALPYLGMTDIASDNAVKGSVPADQAPMADQLGHYQGISPSYYVFSSVWDAYYDGIFRANFAIEGISKMENIDPALQKRLIGENKFLRAYFYFFLVKNYGGVPLLTETLEVGDEFEVPRATVEEVYAQIEKDLEYAIDVLPQKPEYSEEEVGRITKGAARSLLARVHLFQEEYKKAGALATAVIQSGIYSLYPDYYKQFRLQGENKSGSIFEIQAAALATGGGGSQYSQVQGVRGTPNLGWGFNNPSVHLLKAYEPGDPRLQATIMFVYEILPSGEATVMDNLRMKNERYNQKSFWPMSAPLGAGNSGHNIRRIRYADVLLIAAEAAYHNGKEALARKYVNMVRQRARDGRTATIGIQPEGLSPVIAVTIGLSSEAESPIVRYVGPNGPAANKLRSFEFGSVKIGEKSKTLVKNLDIIQKVDGQTVNSLEEYLTIMETKSPGESLTLTVLRITQTFSGGSIQTSSQTLTMTIPTIALLPDVTASGRQLLLAIYHERRVELAMEQHRLSNIQHQGRADEIFESIGISSYDPEVNDIWPIPQDEIDLAGLEQNPGY